MLVVEFGDRSYIQSDAEIKKKNNPWALACGEGAALAVERALQITAVLEGLTGGAPLTRLPPGIR